MARCDWVTLPQAVLTMIVVICSVCTTTTVDHSAHCNTTFLGLRISPAKIEIDSNRLLLFRQGSVVMNEIQALINSYEGFRPYVTEVSWGIVETPFDLEIHLTKDMHYVHPKLEEFKSIVRDLACGFVVDFSYDWPDMIPFSTEEIHPDIAWPEWITNTTVLEW